MSAIGTNTTRGASDANVIASYEYNGTSLIVRKDYPTPDVRLDLYGGTTGTYAGFDRFGRVQSQLWHDYGASADLFKINHGYDRASNRTYADKSAFCIDEFNTDSSANWSKMDGDDSFAVDASDSNALAITGVGANNAAVVLIGSSLGPAQARTTITFPNPSAAGSQAGIVFGYKNANEYWMQVLDLTAQKQRVYHVVGGSKSLIEEKDFTVAVGTAVDMYALSKRGVYDAVGAAYPSGKYGLYSNITGVKFDRFAIFNDAEWPSLADRWMNNTGQDGYNAIDTSTDRLKMIRDDIGIRAPVYLKGVRVKRFEATFNVKREVLGTSNNIGFAFNGTDQDDFDYLRIYHRDTKAAPYAYEFNDGVYRMPGSYSRDSSKMPALTSSSTLWVRVTYNGSSLSVKCATSAGDLDTTAQTCFSTSDLTFTGGMIGFMGGHKGVIPNPVRHGVRARGEMRRFVARPRRFVALAPGEFVAHNVTRERRQRHARHPRSTPRPQVAFACGRAAGLPA